MLSRLLLLATVLLFTLCQPPDALSFPEGEQTIVGILTPTEISLSRRGSHILKDVEGKNLWYVESKTVQLRLYEGKQVTLTGIFEANISPKQLPVLVVSAVEEQEVTYKTYHDAMLGLHLLLPEQWHVKGAQGRAAFFFGDSDLAIARLSSEPRGSLTFDEFLQKFNIHGTPIVIEHRHATRIIDEQSGAQTIVIDQGEKVVTLRFEPAAESADERREEFLFLLNSITFKAVRVDANASSAPSEEESASSRISGGFVGQPCGGPAGILCPDGMYCSVTEFESGIGTCQML